MSNSTALQFGHVFTPEAENPSKKIMDIVCNYELSLDEMIHNSNCDCFNHAIAEKGSPIVGKGTVVYETQLFPFKRDTSSEDADSSIRKDEAENPWKSAGIEHFLAFMTTYPDILRKFPIVGLGFLCEIDGERQALVSLRSKSGYCLGLNRRDRVWPTLYQFLAVREKLSSNSLSLVPRA